MLGKTSIYLRSGLVILLLVIIWLLFDYGVRLGFGGKERGIGTIVGGALPDEIIIARESADRLGAPEHSKQILFGDLHVHTTYSTDAFAWALPVLQGRGIYPIADACDYARYCSSMDFWALTDHAESGTPLRWSKAKEGVRQCQIRAIDQKNPDMVSFLGFEWTQVGPTPEEHYGHKNVIFKDLEDDKVPMRAIGAAGAATLVLRQNISGMPGIVPALDFRNFQTYLDFNLFLKNTRDVPYCDPDVSSDQLPADCFESAHTPGDLVRKLIDEQGLDPLIIPHGTTWGFYTPAGSTWDKQLVPANRPEKQSLIEIFSGHGNTEEFRDYRAFIFGDKGEKGICPPKTDDYTPACVRLGEIIAGRCLKEGTSAEICDERAEHARGSYNITSGLYHLSIGGETPADWLDSGQCQDCYLPTFNHRPLTSAQAGLATSLFEENKTRPTRFNWGFIASSDNHRARPGTGYKEVARRLNTESAGAISEGWRKRFAANSIDPPKDAYIHIRDREEIIANAGLQLVEIERQNSFWLTGGLAAVHSQGRSREQIWAALKRRETFATSGLRMLLWFDWTGQSDEKMPMGSTVSTAVPGVFNVRVLGSFKQKPGCPDYAVDALGADRVQQLCAGECYNPASERHIVERIEIIRIRPQSYPGEALKDLIDDPYMVHQCDKSQSGCTLEFSDPDFSAGNRDVAYYARAVQEPQPTIHGDPLNCEFDEKGNCIKVNLCYGDYRSGDSECTDIKDARAWSSPIYLNYRK